MKVTYIHNLGTTCPTQWEGATDDDRDVYVRYRHGRLTVRLGAKNKHGAMSVFQDGAEIVKNIIVGGPHDGFMSYRELKAWLSDIEWPETETDPYAEYCKDEEAP
jgi:hypothetical protein